MTPLTYSLRLARDGVFINSLSPEQARQRDLSPDLWIVCVEDAIRGPRRVAGWADDGHPLVVSQHPPHDMVRY